MKQLLNRLATTDNKGSPTDITTLPVADVMMPPHFVPDSMPLSSLLKDFTSNRRQMAIVLDEYGGTEGLITLEDILEEIVGDYEDEFTPRHRHIKIEDKQHFIIKGGVRVTELEPKLNFPFPTGDYVTGGGSFIIVSAGLLKSTILSPLRAPILRSWKWTIAESPMCSSISRGTESQMIRSLKFRRRRPAAESRSGQRIRHRRTAGNNHPNRLRKTTPRGQARRNSTRVKIDAGVRYRQEEHWWQHCREP
jgi:hypothetical protein